MPQAEGSRGTKSTAAGRQRAHADGPRTDATCPRTAPWGMMGPQGPLPPSRDSQPPGSCTSSTAAGPGESSQSRKLGRACAGIGNPAGQVGCQLVQPLWRRSWRFLKLVDVRLPYDPATSLRGMWPAGLRTDIPPKHSYMHLTAPFRTENNRNAHRLGEGYTQEGPSVHTLDWHSGLERKEALSLATTCRDPEETMPRE